LPLIYRNIGLAALRLGNFSESLRMLRLAITADAKDDRSRSLFVQTSLEWAKALDEQGKLSQSAKVLEEASSIAPENADVHEALVVVYGKLGKHADAKRHANKLKGLKGQSGPTRSQ
jgi:tetratricopeptide (TPR) repeat protein